MDAEKKAFEAMLNAPLAIEVPEALAEAAQILRRATHPSRFVEGRLITASDFRCNITADDCATIKGIDDLLEASLMPVRDGDGTWINEDREKGERKAALKKLSDVLRDCVQSHVAVSKLKQALDNAAKELEAEKTKSGGLEKEVNKLNKKFDALTRTSRFGSPKKRRWTPSFPVTRSGSSCPNCRMWEKRCEKKDQDLTTLENLREGDKKAMQKMKVRLTRQKEEIAKLSARLKSSVAEVNRYADVGSKYVLEIHELKKRLEQRTKSRDLLKYDNERLDKEHKELKNLNQMLQRKRNPYLEQKEEIGNVMNQFRPPPPKHIAIFQKAVRNKMQEITEDQIREWGFELDPNTRKQLCGKGMRYAIKSRDCQLFYKNTGSFKIPQGLWPIARGYVSSYPC